MQLEVHLGSATKAEDVKGLGWLIPFLLEDVLHCVHVHKISLLDLCTIGLLMLLLQHQASFKNYFSANTAGFLLWADFICLFIFPLRCQSCLCIPFTLSSDKDDISHLYFGPVPFWCLDFCWFALNSPFFCLGRGNPESICSPTLSHQGKSLVRANCWEFFAKDKRVVTLGVLSPPDNPSTKAKSLETGTAVEPILQLTNTSTSGRKGCLVQLLIANSDSDCIVTVTILLHKVGIGWPSLRCCFHHQLAGHFLFFYRRCYLSAPHTTPPATWAPAEVPQRAFCLLV